MRKLASLGAAGLTLLAGCEAKDKQHLESIGRKLNGRLRAAVPVASRTLDGTWETLNVELPGGGAAHIRARLRSDKRLVGLDLKAEEVEPGKVRLTGRVPAENLKQVAAGLADNVVGVEAVANEIQVVPPAKN